jgi:hypothetical protein
MSGEGQGPPGTGGPGMSGEGQGPPGTGGAGMRGERQLLRIGEYVVGRACRRLPRDIGEERYREWAAELPAILHDPQVRLAPRRAVHMLAYAADTLRGTTMAPGRARRLPPGLTALFYLLLAGGLAAVAWDTWAIVRAPGHGLNYVQLTWAFLLVAYPVSVLARSAAHMITLIILSSSTLAGVAVNLWNAAQAPGDWVNYFVAALLLLPLLAVWLLIRRIHTRPGPDTAPGKRAGRL